MRDSTTNIRENWNVETKKNFGLIGMWLHTFDDDGGLDQQLEVIRRSGDVYICRVYSWEHGRPCGCAVLARNKILGSKLHESSQAMNVALENYEEQRRWRQQAEEARQRRELLSAPLTMAN
jgi:hypothetical protein